MAPWLRVVLWILAIVSPGGFALLPILAGDAVKRRRDARARALPALPAPPAPSLEADR